MIRKIDSLCTGDCHCYRLSVILNIYRFRDPRVGLYGGLKLVSVTHA